jgi:hypothetical protein
VHERGTGDERRETGDGSGKWEVGSGKPDVVSRTVNLQSSFRRKPEPSDFRGMGKRKVAGFRIALRAPGMTKVVAETKVVAKRKSLFAIR